MNVDELRWFGPRPLQAGEPLVGRRDELEELIDATRTNELVVVTAATGFGKTSFVRAGAVPTLERAGFRLLGLQPWPRATTRADLARFGSDLDLAAERLYRAAVELELDDVPLGEALKAKAGDRRAVVVLDQVEEVLRYQPAVTKRLLRLAAETARDHDIKHIVIGRSEYLADLLAAVEIPRSATWKLALMEIDDESIIRTIVERGATRRDADGRIVRTAEGRPDVLIDDDATTLIVESWAQARRLVATQRAQRLGAEGVPEVGLLQLQAVLSGLRSWVAGQPGDRVTGDLVERWMTERAIRHGYGASLKDAASWLMQDALSVYVGEVVGRLADPATTTFGRVRPPFVWGAGPQVTLARVASQLSAAGFKQPQTLSALLPTALEEELKRRDARRVGRWLSELPQALPEPGFVPGPETPDAMAVEDPIDRLHRDDFGAGVARDWPIGRVVREMVDALHAALRTMSEPDVNVLREFDRPGQPIYELTHDGMGAALQTWAEEYLETLTADVGGIAAQTGRAVLGHTVDRATVEADAGVAAPQLWGNVRFDDGPRLTLHALRWNGSVIRDCTFSDVTFENCDFAGAGFIGCTLHRVHFVGCRLPAGLFLSCELDDVTVAHRPDQGGDDASLLTVKDPRGAATFALEGLDGTTGIVLTGLSGGTWTISGSRVRHLVVDAVEATSLELRGGTVAWAVSVSELVRPDPDETSTLMRAPAPDDAAG